MTRSPDLLNFAAKIARRATLMILLAGTVSVIPVEADAQGQCKAIRFARGATSAVISSVLPPKDRYDPPLTDCYTLGVSPGQRIRVRVQSGENTAVTVSDVGDAQTEFDFIAANRQYQIDVFQLFPSQGSARYAVFVEALPMSKSKTSGGAASSGARWRYTALPDCDPREYGAQCGEASISYAPGKTLKIECGNGGLGLRFSPSYKPRGDVSLLVDGRNIGSYSGTCDRTGECSRYLFGRELDGLRAGNNLTLVADGKRLAEIPLRGSSAATEKLRSCE